MSGPRFIRPDLTARQEEALYCFGQGWTCKETAMVMMIAPRTAKAHCDNLRRAFGVANKRELVVCAQKYFRTSGPLVTR